MNTVNCKKHGPEAKAFGTPEKRPRCSACNIASVADHRRKLKIKAVEYKGGSCERCGYSKCVAALDFHHVDPKEKDFEISRGCVSWAKITKELDKCLLLCKNCHAEEHEVNS